MPRPDAHVLDTPALSSVRGPHRSLSQITGRVGRYDPAISPFAGVPVDAGAEEWAELGRLVGVGNEAVVFGVPERTPDWAATFRLPCLQMVGTEVTPAEDPEAVVLGPDDVPEMLDLVARTRPGPFGPRTIEMGRYLGLRRNGALVAMAGERMHPPGWTEISAVCTDSAFRGQGLGARMIRAVAVAARRREEGSFLHAVTSNAAAIRLYESLGFRARREVVVGGFTVDR